MNTTNTSNVKGFVYNDLVLIYVIYKLHIIGLSHRNCWFRLKYNRTEKAFFFKEWFLF